MATGAGNHLVAMLHLRPDGAAHDVDFSIGLYFADAAPSIQPAMIRLNRQDIDIRPGDSQYQVVDRYRLPVAVEVYAVQPRTPTIWRARSKPSRPARRHAAVADFHQGLGLSLRHTQADSATSPGRHGFKRRQIS